MTIEVTVSFPHPGRFPILAEATHPGRDFVQSEQQCCLVAGGSNHNDAVLVQDQWLAEAEFTK
jgi:hypothetical protein